MQTNRQLLAKILQSINPTNFLALTQMTIAKDHIIGLEVTFLIGQKSLDYFELFPMGVISDNKGNALRVMCLHDDVNYNVIHRGRNSKMRGLTQRA